MGNTPGKPHPRPKNKKYLQFIGADRPAPPGKPYLATEVESTSDALILRWDPPPKNGGSNITGYLVEHRRTGSPHWVRAFPILVRVAELELSGLEAGWRYQFRVFAENVVGISDSSELSEPLTITLQSARTAINTPKFTQELTDTIALENDKVEFVVHFIGQPPPKLCWFKDGFEIFSSRRTRILTEHDRSILTIHQSAICDEGEIKCTATNKAGHVSTKARLTLEAPPSIRLPRQYEDGLLFEIGELIRFKISVAGLPPPLIFWTHNSESINENERYEIENDDKTSTLRISAADRNDRGEYQIKAVNKLGSDIASFLVTVTDKPSPPGQAKVVMTLGRSVTLSWNTPDDDGGCKIGNYIVEYYRLGWNVWLKAATSRQLTTILGDLIEGSEYKFRIKAESPFGVSEPSEESELVFIPDPKRGILEPVGNRSRSQPRDILDASIPIAAKRKKPRSHSSSRAGEADEDSAPGSPIRPQRIKSPPKTPEKLSPRPERKEINATAINKALFDRASISRDFAYGSPEIKIKKTDVPMPTQLEIKPPLQPKLPNQSLQESIRSTIQIQDRQKQKSPSPRPIRQKSPSPRIEEIPREKSPEFNTFSKDKAMPKFTRDNSENLGGSTEFMMVIYTDNGREMGSTSEFGFDLDGTSVAPPLSLSAPELGSEPPPLFDNLRLSASSTELMHERAMVRFYQEALAEEEAIRRKMERGSSLKLPKIQINDDLVGLERKHSLRRRLSAGGSMPQQLLMAQKRQSLRNSGEFSDLFDSKIAKLPLTVEEKREIMQTRQRSHSEEIEEEEFERVRAKMVETTKPKKKISVVQEEVWDYEESLSESSDDDDERYKRETKILEITTEEEDETYHPRTMMLPQPLENKSKYEEPFEILTKPAKLPDANFVPKPILKKKENGDVTPTQVRTPEIQKEVPAPEPIFLRKEIIPEPPKQFEPIRQDISAVASAGMTAAGILISQPMLQKKEAEEAKVVIEHYGDLVRNASTKTVRNATPVDNNPIREALRKAAQLQAALHRDDEDEEEEEVPKPVTNFLPSNNNKVHAVDERFKSLERKLENQPPRSATPIFKQRQVEAKTDDIFVKPIEIKKEEIIDTRGRDQTRYGSTKRTPSQSKSPHRLNSETRKLRNKSPAPVPAEKRSHSTTRTRRRTSSTARTQSRSNSAARPPSRSTSKQRAERKSPSPTPMLLRKPKMCEIMTQTSTCVDPFPLITLPIIPIDDCDLKTTAQITVRSTMDYLTDLAMFAVACWLFLFSNELFALPVLLIAVYRQLKDEVKRRIPNWIKRRLNKQNKK